MFRNTRAFSGFAVRDVEEAKRFYGETLGLEVTEEYGLLRLHLAGGTEVLAYPRPDHIPATFTILNFPVDDIDQACTPTASPRRGTPAASSTRFRSGLRPGWTSVRSPWCRR